MVYRTAPSRARRLLTLGAGVTLAITQLGAGCVPADGFSTLPCNPDGSTQEAGACRATEDSGKDDAK